MAYAIRFHQTGGPEVLAWEAVEPGEPGPGEARVRHEAVGLNFIDTYHRTGLYPLPLPSGIGLEGAGVVEAIGPGVTEVAVGDRVFDRVVIESNEQDPVVLEGDAALVEGHVAASADTSQRWERVSCLSPFAVSPLAFGCSHALTA